MSESTVGPTSTAAQSVEQFDQSIGVNVHMGYYWTLYNDVTLVESDLAYLGVNQVRDKLLDWSNVQKNYQQLAAAGMAVRADVGIRLHGDGKPLDRVFQLFMQIVVGAQARRTGGLGRQFGPVCLGQGFHRIQHRHREAMRDYGAKWRRCLS